LHRGVAQVRENLRCELGSAEHVHHRLKSQQANAHRASAERAPHQEKPRKPNGGSSAMAAHTPASKVERPAKAKRTAQATKRASSGKREAH
jgi:hypothetical protein